MAWLARASPALQTVLPTLRGTVTRSMAVISRPAMVGLEEEFEAERPIGPGTSYVNKIILMGNVGSDAEERVAGPSGFRWASLSVATNVYRRDNEAPPGENPFVSETTWHRVNVSVPRLMERALKFAKKGAKVYVSGSLKVHQYLDAETGKNRFTHFISVSKYGDEFLMVKEPAAGYHRAETWEDK